MTEMTLQSLGWGPFFQQQLTLEEYEFLCPVRVVQQHRDHLVVCGEALDLDVPIHHNMPPMTVGDWLLLDSERRFQRCLERKSLFIRKAAGTRVQTQYIAANVDTAFLVCSLNQDFNLNRIERYLALVNEAGCEPVVVLTKADLADDAQSFVEQVRTLDPLLQVESLNATAAEEVVSLKAWCRTGSTVVFLGSSGVGKSTLANSLLGHSAQDTGEIRLDDGKGRHTTTGRSLLVLPDGGLLLDTPGMRELQLADVEEGLEKTFADIVELAHGCRFSDCQHDSEPGCAVLEAVVDGALDERRLHNYRKLMREQAQNSATMAEKRARDKSLGKYYKRVQGQSRQQKKGHD